MIDGPRPRRPIKVVIMVIAYWILGNVLQAAFAWLAERSSLVGADSAFTVGLILGWGLLFVISLAFREQLDGWLRA
jgi:hypothetical protein